MNTNALHSLTVSLAGFVRTGAVEEVRKILPDLEEWVRVDSHVGSDDQAKFTAIVFELKKQPSLNTLFNDSAVADMANALGVKTSHETPRTQLGSPGTGGINRDQRSIKILAKTIYRELRSGGLIEEEVMTLVGELLHLVAVDMKDRRGSEK